MISLKRSVLVALTVGGAMLAPDMQAQDGTRSKQPVSSKKETQKPEEQPARKQFVIPRGAKVNFSEIKDDYAPSLMIREMPKQGALRMVQRPGQNDMAVSANKEKKATILPLVKGESLLANPFSVSTPNDNDVAISDSGFVLSVINTNIFIRNTATQISSPVKSLFSFTQPVNNLQDEFDPKVMYDPSNDRFVLVCMVGFVDSTSKIIVGFSQTGNPAGSWNLYALPGDPLQNNLWSDYPMIAMTEKELFLTVNLLYNDSSWQTGFVETVIWQLAKDSGYAGVNLTSELHSNIKLNGRAIRNLCPVKGGSQLYGPEMYFLSNRNLDSQNDTVFLVKTNGMIGATGNSVSVQVLKSNLPYRFPPDAVQKGTNQLLATNDCRNLGAFIENGIIQYVHNTKHPVNNRPTVHYGVIHSATTSPVVTGFLIENDTLDYGYPNISYAGLNPSDNSAIITFNHTSPSVFPGCSAIQADGFGSFSPVLNIRDGQNYVNLLQGDLERWGDYSGSQRRYNKPGEVWMSGYYAYPYGSSFPKAHAAWVAQITTNDGIYVAVPSDPITSGDSFNVFPNPAPQMFSVEFSLNKPEHLTFELIDAKGARTVLMRDWVKVRNNTFSFNAGNLAKGFYILSVSGNMGTSVTKKVVVE